MTLKIQKSASDGFVTLALTGRIQMEHLLELHHLVEFEDSDQGIVLDLQEVKLIDREAVKFLMQCEAAGARLDNCPAYIREWISKERRAQSSDEKEI